VVAALLARGAGHVGDGAPGVNDQRELLRWRPDVEPRRVVPEPERQRAPSSAPQIQHIIPKKNWGQTMSTNKKKELYRPVGEEIVVEAHARVGVRPVAEPTPQRGGEPAGVGVGAREREEQRRRRHGPIGGSGGGRGRGGQEEDGGEGLERAGPRPAPTRHGAASPRGE
jgi:hypothetical protein